MQYATMQISKIGVENPPAAMVHYGYTKGTAQPSMTRCESCGEPFPVMPVDERTVHYVKIMLANGRAALDPDFA
mgnify:CR=1 FL=1